MAILTIDEFKEQFESIIDRAHSGETFYLNYNNKNFLITPYHISEEEEDDDLVRIHRDHEEGS